jgi:hypothetical protein
MTLTRRELLSTQKLEPLVVWFNSPARVEMICLEEFEDSCSNPGPSFREDLEVFGITSPGRTRDII